MAYAPDTSPTILLVAEDLLVSLLAERLIGLGYQVSTPDQHWTDQSPAQVLPIDLILAEVRYPYDACLATIAALRSLAAQADIPVVLIGYAPAQLHQRLEGRVTWLEGGAPLDVIVTAVSRWSSQHPDPTPPLLRARPLDVGQHQP
jgi:response regulator RpfG family c-di-GMP phosphodiesterase